jgi:hypothetical protein
MRVTTYAEADFEVKRMVTVMKTVFWLVMSLVRREPTFRGLSLLSASVTSSSLHGLLLEPEDEGGMFIRIVGPSPNYTALQPREPSTFRLIRNAFTDCLQERITKKKRNSFINIQYIPLFLNFDFSPKIRLLAFLMSITKSS